MRKILALLLALAMLLTGAAALADSVKVSFQANPDVIKQALPIMGSMNDSDLAKIDPIAQLLNKLSLTVTTAGNAGQVDIAVGDTTALSLAGQADDEGFVIGASLLPNYLIKITQEDIQGLMQSMGMQMGGGSFDLSAFSAIAEKMVGYVQPAVMTIMGATTAGEPETGSFEFEGYTFDTKTPQNVDVMAIAEAIKKMVSDIMNDQEITGLLQTVSSGSFDPQQIVDGLNQTLTEDQMPDVKVDVYTRGSDSAFYAASDATFKGSDAPAFTFGMLQREDGTGLMKFDIPASGVTISAEYSQSGVFVQMTGQEESQYFAVGLNIGAEVTIDLYAVVREPMLTIVIASAPGGEITLPLAAEGKTVLGLADMMGQGSDAAQAMLQEAQTGLLQLMAIPELAELIATFTAR